MKHPNKPTFHTAFLAFFIACFLIIAIKTLPDYGFTWDGADFYIGDKYFYFFKELNPDYLIFSLDNIDLYNRPDHPDFYYFSKLFRDNPYWVWPVGSIASSCTKYIFFTRLAVMDAIDAHHIVVPLLAAVLIIALYVFAVKYIGWQAAVIAIVSLATYPRFWAHLHNNTKDIPSTVMFSLVILSGYHAVRKRRPQLIIATGFLWGLALASKANAVFVVPILVPFLVAEAWMHRKRVNWILTRPSLLAFFSVIPVAILTMFLVWPYLLLEFPENALTYLKYLMTRGGDGDPGWNIIPLTYAVTTMPIPVIILLTIGLGKIAATTIRQRSLDSLHLLIVLWLIIPVLRVSIPYANDFDGIRHWMEFLPAAAIIAGIGGATLLDSLRLITRRFLSNGWASQSAMRTGLFLLMVTIYFLPVIAWNTQNHPNQIVFFNAMIGRLAGAQQRGLPEATDYWGSSYRSGIKWLNEHAPERSLLLTGVGEHIVHIVEKVWLRDDIVNARIPLHPNTQEVSPELLNIVDTYDGDVYLMYITRQEHYSPFLKTLDATLAPVFEITVDGGSILKILRLDGR